MKHPPSRRWSTPEELLDEWAQVSAVARRPTPARARAPRPIVAGAAVAVAALALVAVVAVAAIVTRPLGIAAPPGATATVAASVLDDPRPATWRVNPWADISPESTSVAVLLTERECASAQSPEGRVAEPLIEYTAATIVIVLRVQMIGGDCPSNPEFPMTVELSEPIGQRALVDAGESPPAERWKPGAATCEFVPANRDIDSTIYTLVDKTGLISSCEVFPAAGDIDTSARLSNPANDLRVLELLWLDGACGDRTIKFGRTGGQFSLDLALEPLAAECPAVGLSRRARFELRGDVPAEAVIATYGPTPPAAATPTSNPATYSRPPER